MPSRRQSCCWFLRSALVAVPLTHAQEGLQAPANIRVVNGPNPGEAIITWDAADGANFYRIGWLSRVDYLDAGEDWLERFAYSDVEGKTSYKVTRLTPGEYYWFIGASNATYSGAPTWPDEWTSLTLNEDAAACPPAETAPSTFAVQRRRHQEVEPYCLRPEVPKLGISTCRSWTLTGMHGPKFWPRISLMTHPKRATVT